MKCYQCDKESEILFDDSRCGDCTAMTPEEVRGEIAIYDEPEGYVPPESLFELMALEPEHQCKQ